MAEDPGERHATINDVARVAGVSRAAVSKVLRKAYGVSPAMRERVMAAIDELEYRPRVAARALGGRSYTIGIEVPDLENPFIAKVIAGAAGALIGTAYELVIAPAERGEMEGVKALAKLSDRQVDGIIAISPPVSQHDLERMARSTPLVMFGRHDVSSEYDTVAGDDGAGATAAMRHLLELGHRRITHLTIDGISADPRLRTPHGIRIATYLRCMSEAALDDFARVARSAEGETPAYEAVMSLIGSGDRPTAIFAAHDQLALGALRAIMATAPGTSVVGYDDVPMASHPALSLTTVSQPAEAMGWRAAKMLLERFGGRTTARYEVFDAVLQVRDSTRPLRKGLQVLRRSGQARSPLRPGRWSGS